MKIIHLIALSLGFAALCVSWGCSEQDMDFEMWCIYSGGIYENANCTCGTVRCAPGIVCVKSDDNFICAYKAPE
ncbi:MAG: hypothetical protein IJM59_07800 [Proteobacteria bacterium]|nr:hypothetical protein [Pseudomonadota bacterium]